MSKFMNVTELAEFLPAEPSSRVVIREAPYEASAPLPDVPAVNTSPETSLIASIKGIGRDSIILYPSEEGLTLAGIGGQKNIAIDVNLEYRDVNVVWDDAEGNGQMRQLDADDVVELFGSLDDVYCHPSRVLKLINPAINF